MSTTNSISDSLGAYGVHAFGGFAAAYSMYRLVKMWDEVNVEENAKSFSKYVAPLSSLTVGAAASMFIAWSTKAQNLALHLLCGGFTGGTRWVLEYAFKRNKQIAWTKAENTLALTTFISLIADPFKVRAVVDTFRPLMSSHVSIVCGVAGAIAGSILGFLASRDPAAGQGPEVEQGRTKKRKI
jgi:hypothetical protein